MFSREQLLKLAWGFDFYGQTRTVDVHIAHLRKKLESGSVKIGAVPGVGISWSFDVLLPSFPALVELRLPHRHSIRCCGGDFVFLPAAQSAFVSSNHRTVERRTAGGHSELSCPLIDSAKRTALTFDVRIALYSQGKQLLCIGSATANSAINFPVKRLLLGKLPLARDAKGSSWLYSLQQLPDQTYLLVATPRPRFSVLGLFTGDLLPIFLQSGSIALVLSLIVAFIFARWLADPLQKMIVAARGMPSAEAKPVEVQGPHEVQELMRAFNAMMTHAGKIKSHSVISWRTFPMN